MVALATSKASRQCQACTQMWLETPKAVLSAQGHADWQIPQGAVISINQLQALRYKLVRAIAIKREVIIFRLLYDCVGNAKY